MANPRNNGGPPPQLDGPGDRSPRKNPFGAGLGYDPAKPAQKVITNTRIDLPASAYMLENNVSSPSFDSLSTFPSFLKFAATFLGGFFCLEQHHNFYPPMDILSFVTLFTPCSPYSLLPLMGPPPRLPRVH